MYSKHLCTKEPKKGKEYKELHREQGQGCLAAGLSQCTQVRDTSNPLAKGKEYKEASIPTKENGQGE